MKIIYLASAKPDLRWFKHYYMSRFPEGRRNADTQFLSTKALLLANPFVGHSVENIEGARIYSIPRTPFSFVYRVTEEAVEVVRVLDTRSEDSNDIL